MWEVVHMNYTSRYSLGPEGPPADQENRAQSEQEMDDARLRTHPKGEHSPGDQRDEGEQERDHRSRPLIVDGVWGVFLFYTRVSGSGEPRY